MKELFGINVTENRKNAETDGERYCTSKVVGFSSEKLEKAFEELDEIENKGTLPTWLYIIASLLFLFGLICVFETVPDYKTAFNNAPGLVVSGIISFIVGGGFLLYEKLKVRSNKDSEEYRQADNALENNAGTSLDELNIPSDAETVNAFIYKYKTKDGKNEIRERFRGHFINFDAFVFTEGDDFCIADLETRYDIPLSSITELGVEKKGCFVSGWTKDVPLSEYKLRTDNLGRVCLKSRAYMLFYLGGQEFRLYFPEYEMPVFRRLTGRE